MKSKSSLTIPLLLSLFAAQAVIGADAKKTTKKTTKVEAKPEAVAQPAKADAPAAPAADAKAAAPAAPAVEIKDPVAVVEGTEITKAEMDTALAGVLAQQGRPASSIPEDQKVGVYRMLIEDMIVEKLVNKRSEAIKISDEEVESTFKKATAGHSDEEVKAQIEKSGQTLERVKEQIRTSLRQKQWIDDQIKGKDEVTDAEAEEFYKKNPDQFKMPERVRASHILISVKADATPEVVLEKEKAAKAIYERVKKGEDFAKLAKELSEDPSAKQNSGDLDFFAKEQMVPEFSSVAFGLKKDEISQPVRSQFGYHIIKATDRKEAETIPLEKAKPQLLAYLKQQKKQGEVEKVVRALRASADVKVNLPAAPAPTAAAEAPTAAPTAAPAEAAPAPKNP